MSRSSLYPFAVAMSLSTFDLGRGLGWPAVPPPEPEGGAPASQEDEVLGLAPAKRTGDSTW
ncbi:MAG: hypothetical protein ACLFS8_03520 [Clostridia bacterium]